MHPAIPFFIAAVLVLVTNPAFRKALQLAVPAISLWLLWPSIAEVSAGETAQTALSFLGRDWIFVRADSLSLLFVYAFLLFSFLANLFALHVKNRFIHAAASGYVGSSIAAVLAGDILTLFIFWELMAIFSACLVWNKRKTSSLASLYRYLLIHGLGGLFFFTGILLRILNGDSLVLSAQAWDSAGILLFLAVMINAAIPPLHAWLPDAYASGSPEGSVYLSAFTTKVAVYVFARCFPGEPVLIWLGVIAAFYGVIFALMENDMRKLLSYHIVCQIGYMIAGIGLGSHLGINAGTGHAVGNILFKGLLFMATGAVIHMTWRSKLSDLGGLARRLPFLFILYTVGALAISGMPLLNGYVTKSMLVSAALKEHKGWLELSLLLVAVGTFLSIALKLAYFAFFHKPYGRKKLIPLPSNCYGAMGITALCCLFLGVFPGAFYSLLPHPVRYDAYTPDHVLEAILLLLGAFFGFLLIVKKLQAKAMLTLDTDWFYRKGATLLMRGICYPLRHGQELVQQRWTAFNSRLYRLVYGRFGSQAFTSTGYPLLWMLLGFIAAGITIVLLH